MYIRPVQGWASTVTDSLHIDQLAISVFLSIYCKDNLLWRRLRDAVICEYTNMSLWFLLLLCWFSGITPVSPLTIYLAIGSLPCVLWFGSNQSVVTYSSTTDATIAQCCHILSLQSLLSLTEFTAGGDGCLFFSSSTVHSIFLPWKLASRDKTSSQYRIDIPIFYDSSMWCLLPWGLTLSFWTVAKSIGKSLTLLGGSTWSHWLATQKEVTIPSTSIFFLFASMGYWRIVPLLWGSPTELLSPYGSFYSTEWVWVF